MEVHSVIPARSFTPSGAFSARLSQQNSQSYQGCREYPGIPVSKATQLFVPTGTVYRFDPASQSLRQSHPYLLDRKLLFRLRDFGGYANARFALQAFFIGLTARYRSQHTGSDGLLCPA